MAPSTHDSERPRRRGSRTASSASPAPPASAQADPAAIAGALGNQAVQRLLQRGVKVDHPASDAEREAKAAGEAVRAAPSSGRTLPPVPSRMPDDTLAAELRESFGPGRPVGGARVHDDARAAGAARALGADAWTLGKDIFLDPTAAPRQGADGRGLLAHELTHAAQHTEQRAQGAEPRIARQPRIPGTTADPREALRARLQQVRARLGALRGQQAKSQANFAQSSADARQKESLARAAPQMVAARRSSAAAKELWGGARAAERIKSAVQVSVSGTFVDVRARLQLSYLALDEKKGRAQAEKDIPRIAPAIRDAWQVTIPDGEYAGVQFRLTPTITYLPPATKRAADAFLIQVRGPDKEPSSGDSVHGIVSLATAHLEGSRVIVVAHELAHVFGFMDAYFSMQKNTPRGPGPEIWNVARGDPANRPDLLGLIDPVLLERYLKKGAVTKADVARQTAATPRIWAEDAAIVLRSLGVAPPPTPRPTPESEDFDPDVELEEEARPKRAELAQLRKRRAQVDDSMAWLDRAEEIMHLEREERELSTQLGEPPTTGAP